MTATEPASTTDAWTRQLEQLQACYKHVRPPVLAALNILVHDQNITIDDAKAQAALHGVRITAASVGAGPQVEVCQEHARTGHGLAVLVLHLAAEERPVLLHLRRARGAVSGGGGGGRDRSGRGDRRWREDGASRGLVRWRHARVGSARRRRGRRSARRLTRRCAARACR